MSFCYAAWLEDYGSLPALWQLSAAVLRLSLWRLSGNFLPSLQRLSSNSLTAFWWLFSDSSVTLGDSPVTSWRHFTGSPVTSWQLDQLSSFSRWFSDGFMTALKQLFDGCLADLLQLSSGSLATLRQLSDGSLTLWWVCSDSPVTSWQFWRIPGNSPVALWWLCGDSLACFQRFSCNSVAARWCHTWFTYWILLVSLWCFWTCLSLTCLLLFSQSTLITISSRLPVWSPTFCSSHLSTKFNFTWRLSICWFVKFFYRNNLFYSCSFFCIG